MHDGIMGTLGTKAVWPWTVQGRQRAVDPTG